MSVVGTWSGSRVSGVYGSIVIRKEAWFYHNEEEAWYTGSSEASNEGIAICIDWIALIIIIYLFLKIIAVICC